MRDSIRKSMVYVLERLTAATVLASIFYTTYMSFGLYVMITQVASNLLIGIWLINELIRAPTLDD